MKKQKNRGISLIVLVITIIVMIILAGAVVITLSNSGIIGKANMAVAATDAAQMQDLATMLWADAYLDNKRGEELAGVVKAGLEDADENYKSKYNVNITDAGVTVSNKKIYFGKPYIYAVPTENADEVKETYIFHEDGSAEIYGEHNIRINVLEAGSCTYSLSGVSVAGRTFEFSDDETSLTCEGKTYKLEKDLIYFWIVRDTTTRLYYSQINMKWSDWCNLGPYNFDGEYHVTSNINGVVSGPNGELLYHEEGQIGAVSVHETVSGGETYYH